VLDFNSEEGDRVQLTGGNSYSLVDSEDGVIIRMANGAEMQLIGVSLESLGDWLA
jgi:hypothetical protein